MKIFYLLILLIFSCTTYHEMDKNFIDKVLSDYDEHSFFVSIKIRSNGQTQMNLIENDELFHFFKLKKDFNEEEYKKYMSDVLFQDLAINITGEELEEVGFKKVIKIKEVDDASKKGKDFFIKKYFKERVLIEVDSEYERNYIIQKLFEWEIPTKIDDETGHIILFKFY